MHDRHPISPFPSPSDRRSSLLPALPLPFALFLLSAACGTATAGDAEEPSASTPTVAVLPPAWLTETPSVEVDAGSAAVAGLVAVAGVAVVEPARSAAAVPPDLAASCTDDLACLCDTGERLGATKVLWIRLAGLGDTVAIRIGLVDVASGTQELARQEVVQQATAERVAETVERLAREIGGPLAPPPAPGWYEQWETWVGIGAGILAVAGGVTAGVLLSGESAAGPDETVTPP
jgi:hypothetical protein